MEKKFAIGDRVGAQLSGRQPIKPEYNEDDSFAVGEVTDISAKGQVFVTWDSAWLNKNPPIAVDTEWLMSEADIEQEWSRLENEFRLVENEVKVKVEEASKLLREAGAIAQKTGTDLRDMYNAVRPLLSAMDANGWNTSSFNC